MPTRLATKPQIALPSAIIPLNTIIKIDRPRARTAAGRLICAATFTVATTATQATPAASSTGTTLHKPRQNAVAPSSTADAMLPRRAIRSALKRARQCGSHTTAAIPPTPRQPSSNP